MAKTFPPADYVEVVSNPTSGRGFWGDFERHRLNAIKGHLRRQGLLRNPAYAELANPEDYAVLDNVWWGNPRRKGHRRRRNPEVQAFFSFDNLFTLFEMLIGVAISQGFASAALAGQQNPSPLAEPFLRFLAMGILGFFSNAAPAEWQGHLTAVANGAGIGAVAAVVKQVPWFQTNVPGLVSAVGGGAHGPALPPIAVPAHPVQPWGPVAEDRRVLLPTA